MSANNQRLSPRQKMINLMYIVFLAMVALNVSSDVLSGFKHVEDALDAGNADAVSRNDRLYQQFCAACDQNPDKVGPWLHKATQVREGANELVQYIDSLRLALAIEADGEEADPHNIKDREDLEAVSQVMTSPLSNQADVLDARLKAFGQKLETMVPEKFALGVETGMFENIPVAAAVTLLSKLEGDVRNTEGHALTSLMESVDRSDIRVNSYKAFVIPNARNVMRGQTYEAQIVMAAVDTTQTPAIYIGDKLYETSNGRYSITAAREGIQSLEGYLEVKRPDGASEQLPFRSDYFVSEPVATVSNTMMNVMYAGIDNPLSISVPGVAASQVSASMTNGTLTRGAQGWVAKPSDVGKDAVITVTATQNGKSMTVSQTAFKVRRLPDPTPYLIYKDAAGHDQRYKGGVPIAKAALLNAGGIRAAIDDGLLNVEFTVKSFRIDIFDSMGNDIPEDSQTAQYSDRQRTAIQRLQRGKKFFITRVKAVGPDGIERTLAPIEVIVN